MKKRIHTDVEEEKVMTFLSDGKWHKGTVIKMISGVNERMIRSIAEKTAKLISGNEGYKRVDKASENEINHHIASLRSRANKITLRADAIERRNQ